jgi:transposase InsO family protein
MRDLLILVVHLITTVFRLARPGGLRAVVAESVLTKHQMLILNRSRRRSPNLRIRDRLIAGFCSLWIKPSRLRKVAIAFKTSTLLSFHRALVQRKYRQLSSPKQRTKPGPKGPIADLIRTVVEMKKRNPTWGCPQIADQINLAFGTSINKDVVRRILAIHYQPAPSADGPSWLTLLGHTKDSLWSLDLFCCESMMLRTHWVLVVMDHYTRRIIGFGIHAGVVNGEALCRMFKQAIRGVTTVPRYLSSDHDPLYRFHQWEANLRILGVTEIKTVPYVPWSHPFIERLIGTIRRECLDRLLFWTATDLELKLLSFRDYYNRYRTHSGLEGQTPIKNPESKRAELKLHRWQAHCRGLYQTPIAA